MTNTIPIHDGKKPFNDVAIRATVRQQTDIARNFALVVRGRVAGGDRYRASEHGTRGYIRRDDAGQPTELAVFDLPAGFPMTDTYTAEFRAQGGVLALLLDGRELARAQDTSRTSGQNCFVAGLPDQILLSKLEYRELPAPAAKSASAPAGGGTP